MKGSDTLAKKKEYVWAVKLDDQHSLEIRDLPVGVIDEIAQAAQVGWPIVVDRPTSSLPAMQLLVARVAQHLDVAAPTGSQTVRSLLKFFELVEDHDPPIPDEFLSDSDPTSGGETSTAG